MNKASVLSLFRGIGLGIGIAGILLFLFCTTGRIDSPEEQSFALKSAYYLPLPLSLSIFLLAYAAGRKCRQCARVIFCLALSALVWATGWRIANYSAHYPDRKGQMLRDNGLVR
jgi:hypothetical protein